MKLSKEVRQLIAPYLGLGFTLARTARSHYRVLDPSGRTVAIVPHTPSDGRSLLNTKKDIERAIRLG